MGLEVACTPKGRISERARNSGARRIARSLYLGVVVAVSVVIAGSQCRRFAVSQFRYRSVAVLLSQSLSQLQYRSRRNAEDSGRYSLSCRLGHSVGNLFNSEQDVKRTVKS